MAIRVDIRVDMELEVQLQTTRREGKTRSGATWVPTFTWPDGEYAQPLLELDSRDRFLSYSVLVGMVEHGDCPSLSLHPNMAVMFQHFL